MKFLIVRTRRDVIGAFEGSKEDAHAELMACLSVEPDASFFLEEVK